ncbi:phage capsid protein [Burkholderia gladioli]|uniref:phage capsid protein n=1 Tax=Burkholderia gladioli TaxID=28095 RepID=UPI00163E3F11|nr:phage capsid protein [Burkholderia gladioli]
MSDTLVNLYAQQFKGNLQLLLQQRGSRLRSSITESGDYFGNASAPIDQIGSVDMDPVTGRYQPIQGKDVPNDRRWVFPQDFDIPVFVDTFDKLRLVSDPTSTYVQAVMAGVGRKTDDIIIGGIFGANKTGVAGGTTVTFPAAQQVSASLGATGATGLNVAKLKKGLELLIAAEIDLDNDPVYMPISAKQNTDLMNEIQVINGDYQTLGASVEKGRLMSYMGINFIHSERLPVNGSGYRRCPLYVKSGVHLAIWADAMRVDISQRKDLKGMPWQIYTYMTMDATRVEEKRIVEIPCLES